MIVPSIFLGMQVYGPNLKVCEVNGFHKDRGEFTARLPDGTSHEWRSIEKYLKPVANRENFLRAIEEWNFVWDEPKFEEHRAALKEMFRALHEVDKHLFTKVVDIVTTCVPQ